MLRTLPRVSATLAGTTTSAALALWQRWNAWQAVPSPLSPAATPGTSAIALHHWQAAPGWDVPSGCVFWLPTPAQASATERALEQACRSQWLPSITAGSASVQVLYGGPQQQWQALLHCLAALQPAATLPLEAPALVEPAPLAAHRHDAGLRCRECLDPHSEQRLFSHLLGHTDS